MRLIWVVLAILVCVVPTASGSSIKHRHPSLKALRHLDLVVLAAGPGVPEVEPLCRDLYGIVRASLNDKAVEVGPYSQALWSEHAHLRVVAESRLVEGCASVVRLRVLLEYVEPVFVGAEKVRLPELVSTWQWWDDVDIRESAVEATIRASILRASGFFAADVSYAKEPANK
jgi:hypothetical protein